MSPVIQIDSLFSASFKCPGCRLYHQVMIGDGPSPRWTFNGDLGRPTLTPSILTQGRSRHGTFYCHSFVTDGEIRFLEDSQHDLAGKTVRLTPINEASK